MPSESEQNTPNDSSSRGRLPFEPVKTRKKTEKKVPAAPAQQKEKPAQPKEKPTPAKKERPGRANRADTAIPEVVSRRMVRRMALFSGIPTALGVSTFFASYLIVTQEWIALPNVAVVLVSMGFFGLGVIGLTYGVLSASWDEETAGSRLGFSEFKTNLGRMTEAWRSAGKKP